MRILVTGAAGFIGSHLGERLLSSGHDLVAIDNFNDFYAPESKRRNFTGVMQVACASERDCILCEGDIRDAAFVDAVFAQEGPDAVIHLAAAAGVRPSIQNPLLYEEVNVRGTLNLLEAARKAGIRPFVFSSSSSVYGENPKVPFAESDPVDNPISPYAATKKAGELVCHSWHHLYRMNIACLRFFTVYGPRQRPDLAISKFIRLIDAGEPIPLFGDGSTSRDYTYIDDIVDGVGRALAWVCADDCRYDIFNLGESRPVELRRLVEVIESALGKKAVIDRQPLQPGDVARTYADLDKSSAVLGYRPTTAIEDGVAAQVRWYRAEKSRQD
jgi:UDP-glucuronate 4-epimerase